MSGVLDLARPDLRALRTYQPGAYEADSIRLNANESPWRLPSDTTERGLNVYPPPRPERLRQVLAAHYDVPEPEMLITRGSSEAIDLLIRGFCRAGHDAILISPPTFDLYRVYATIQGAAIRTAPLVAEREFAFDPEAVLAHVDESTKIVFVCSPNNPSGASAPHEAVEWLCEALAGRALVVIDEAYHEFSATGDFLDLRRRFEHVVLLRTLSKFVALAGARCGALIAAPEVVAFLEGVLPPYTFPTPSIEAVLEALDEPSLVVARERVELIRRERQSLADALRNVPDVRHVYPSDANFLLVRVRNRDAFADAARKARILVRRFDGDPSLADCLRITIGKPEDNDRLLEAVGARGQVQ